MGIGGCSRVYLFIAGIFHHLQEIGIEVWLALEIKDEVKKFLMNFVNGSFKKIILQHAGGPGKLPKAAGAFGAAEIAAGGWLKGNRHGVAPLNGLVKQPAGIKTTEYFDTVCKTPEGKFA